MIDDIPMAREERLRRVSERAGGMAAGIEACFPNGGEQKEGKHGGLLIVLLCFK